MRFLRNNKGEHEMKAGPIFLSDKFTPAQLPEICAPRKSLLTRFDEAAEDGFVFVSAQGGSGKTVTTLLWLDKAGMYPFGLGWTTTIIPSRYFISSWLPVCIPSSRIMRTWDAS